MLAVAQRVAVLLLWQRCWQMGWFVPLPSAYPAQHQQTDGEHAEWNPKLYVSEHRRQHRAAWAILRSILSHRN
jgi:hypothetical protein